jgi:hypothetical protein
MVFYAEGLPTLLPDQDLLSPPNRRNTGMVAVMGFRSYPQT